ncbi:MAG: hypothetical protein ACE5MB_00990 [Anaerolineae bacterium]
MAEEREERPKGLLQVCRNVKARFKGLFPEDFWKHQRAARREMLLSVRSLIDAAIESLEEKPPKKATKIKVE